MEALSVQSDKPALRRHFRELRRKYTAAHAMPVAARLQTHLRRLLGDLSSLGSQTGLYRALPDEASAELTPFTEFFFPRLSDQDMEFWRPLREEAFELNSFKIPEPIMHSSERLDPRRPMLICCPAVAVDWYGGRLGMGKGYYDRFFSTHPSAVRIGVVYQVQVSKHPLPADGWDQVLDWIVTDQMILRTSKRSP